MITLDLHYGIRQLIKSPAFTVTAVLSLALGVGATVAMFSVVYGVLLHPFPYADVDRMCNLSLRDQRGEIFDGWFRGPELRELRNVHSFESIATWNRHDLTLTGGDVPEEVVAYYGIGESFPTSGVPAWLGRNLGPSDSPDGQEPQPVVELHYRFWQRHFKGDREIIGKTLELDHKKYTVVGITRPNFTWDWGADVYLPQEISNPEGGGVVVRLRSGSSPAAANAELQPLLDHFAKEHPNQFSANDKADIRPLTWEVRQNMGGPLYLLFAAVIILLVIGCGNVSILLLARGEARQHEFAVRAAVGAGGMRIVRQLLTESLLLAATATLTGIVLAYFLLALIVRWLPPHLFPPDVAIGVNLPVLLFSTGLAMVSTVLFGLSPALRMSRPKISDTLKSNNRKATGNARARRSHGTLVATQIALTLLLLTAAGTVIETFARILRAPLGYDPHHVIALGIRLRENSYANWQARVRYFEDLRASIATLPDVESASIAPNSIPPDSGERLVFEMLGKPAASPETQTASIHLADPVYFQTLHVPLLGGRTWSPAEVANGSRLVLVNQTFVRHYSPNEDVVGHSVKIHNLQGRPPDSFSVPGVDGWMQVIGVTADSVNDGPDRPIRPAIFLPYSIDVFMGTQILVRTRTDPEPLLRSMQKQIAAINPDQEVRGKITNLEARIQDEPAWARGRLNAALFGGFSLLALILSAIGLYSVVSYTVAQRANEFGIRLALGAARSHVWHIVLGSLVACVGGGVLVGLVLTLALNRIAQSWSAGYRSKPEMLLPAIVILALVSGLACALPAWRASTIEPMVALRSE
jgi:predicted permease